MTTPERSVEEIVVELNDDFMAIIKEFAPNWYAHLVDSDENKGEVFRQKITQTLQAERQRCEEMVEAERERIYNYLATRDLPDEDGCSPVLTAREMAVELKQALIKQ